VTQFRELIERGDVGNLRRALDSEPALANQPIRWFLNQQNESDPLHYVSDCVGQGWLTNGTEGEIAEILLAHGAAIDGTEARESPLIASASLGAEKVSKVLIGAGAQLESISIFGARALHWGAWMGAPSTVNLLVNMALISKRSVLNLVPPHSSGLCMGTDREVPRRREIKSAQPAF